MKDISLTVHKGEVLGLFGLMGAGRTELARMIFGLDTYTQGEIVLDGSGDRDSNPKNRVNQGMAFLTEDRREEGLFMEASVAKMSPR